MEDALYLEILEAEIADAYEEHLMEVAVSRTLAKLLNPPETTLELTFYNPFQS